jgi:hypothetical protein
MFLITKQLPEGQTFLCAHPHCTCRIQEKKPIRLGSILKRMSKAQDKANLHLPNPVPLKVKLPPPVVPLFVPTELEIMPPSYEKPKVIDQPSSPAVTASTMLPAMPPLVLHTADESDTQSVACVADLPVCPLQLYLRKSKNTRDHIFS